MNKLSLLLVEDNPGDALLVEDALHESFGDFDLAVATRISEALQALDGNRFDAVLLDLGLPDSTGLDGLSTIRARANEPAIVVLSGMNDEALALQAVRMGADDYLIKGQVFGRMLARGIVYAIERRLTRRRLEDSETQYRSLFETMAQGVVYQNAEGIITNANPAAERILGLTIDQLQGRTSMDPAWQAVREDGSEFAGDQHPAMVSLRTGVEQPPTIMGIRRGGQGEVAWILVHSRPQFRNNETVAFQVYTTFTDITELRRAEEALKRSEKRFRSLIEKAHDGIVVIAADGTLRYVSPAVQRMLGYRDDEIAGSSYRDFLHPDDVGTLKNDFSSLLTEQPTEPGRLARVRRKDGSWRRLLASASDLSADPEVGGIVVNVHDVTQMYDTQVRLHELHDRLLAVVNTTPLGIVVVDPDHNVQLWNRAAEAIFGWTAEEIIGRPYPLLGSDAEPASHPIFSGIWQGKSVAGAHVKRLAKDGTKLDIELWNALLRDERGAPIGALGILADITKRVELERALAHSQRMESVGRLAGGIAHDFNNILTALGGYADLMFEQLHQADPMIESVTEIRRGVDRAAKLTQQLLAFSRKQVLQPVVLDLGALVADTRGILRRVLPENVIIDAEIDRNAWVRADPVQLEQVLLNLALNARDAMPDGGELRIAITAGRNGQSFVVLRISDTGTGIPSELLPKIFEPFFTTKPPGKGTGLGLATVYGIVEQSGGEISVTSTVGAGTTFEIYFPAVNPPADVEIAPRGARHPRGTGTILLVEDEESVRALLTRMLRRNGYTVIHAQNGGEALMIAEREGEGIDLLLTDVIMPHMSGRELAERLQRARPSLKVLYMSGYSSDIIGRHGVLDEGMAFLQKPFTAQRLADKVAEILVSAN